MNLLAFVPGPMEWGVIGLVAVLIFGNKLPSIARSVGSSFVEFKSGLKSGEDSIKDMNDELRS